jgi:hypothetical protein
MQLHTSIGAETLMSRAVPAPTTQEIRDAVTTIHAGVHDPDADPIAIAAAHTLLARARDTSHPPVQVWLDTYLDDGTTAHGPDVFRDAVLDLAQHFKLPPVGRRLSPGEQGTLFD